MHVLLLQLLEHGLLPHNDVRARVQPEQPRRATRQVRRPARLRRRRLHVGDVPSGLVGLVDTGARLRGLRGR